MCFACCYGLECMICSDACVKIYGHDNVGQLSLSLVLIAAANANGPTLTSKKAAMLLGTTSSMGRSIQFPCIRGLVSHGKFRGRKRETTSTGVISS